MHRRFFVGSGCSLAQFSFLFQGTLKLPPLKHCYVYCLSIASVTIQVQAVDSGSSTIGDKALWILLVILVYLLYIFLEKKNAHLAETKSRIRDIENSLEKQNKEFLKGNDTVEAHIPARRYYRLKRQSGALTNYVERGAR
jgi:cell division protein FtsL